MKKKLEDNKVSSWKIFERIAVHYDLINRVLSLGLDKKWRRAMLAHMPTGNKLALVDIATGTGDVILFLRHQTKRITKATGIDRSPKILQIAEKKTLATPFANTTQYLLGNGEKLPLRTGIADVATLSFGVRNFNSPLAGLSEMHRILKPKGKALVLEFSKPKNPIIKFFYFFYLRTIVPFVGGVISGSFASYRYLNKTIETFPSGKNFLSIMENAGFEKPFVLPMLFGGVSLYVAKKSATRSKTVSKQARKKTSLQKKLAQTNVKQKT